MNGLTIRDGCPEIDQFLIPNEHIGECKSVPIRTLFETQIMERIKSDVSPTLWPILLKSLVVLEDRYLTYSTIMKMLRSTRGVNSRTEIFSLCDIMLKYHPDDQGKYYYYIFNDRHV